MSINPLQERRAGALLHPTSLPNGCLDDDVLRWLDFMAAAGLRVWQMLPLVIPDHTGSPYQSCSAFAADPRLVSNHRSPIDRDELAEFRVREADWIEDFALFRVLQEQFDGRPWHTWPTPYARRDPTTLERVRHEHGAALDAIIFEQLRFDHRWREIRKAAQARDIALFGDIPIFIAHDSADVWAHPNNFLLDADLQPTFVAGVPPDYFSATGQRWGNPHYDWETMQADGFSWWISRLRRQFEWYDIVRLDHFRGLVAVWMIAADCPTAIDGSWQETPGDELLATLQQRFPELPIVAEDLGVITAEVRELRRKYALPGMAVLQFAFDAFGDNPHKPVNIEPDTVVYVGTHDNNTAYGWFAELADHERGFVFETLGCEPNPDIAGVMMEAALRSRGNLAVLTLQDMLRLGADARMNTPGMADDNWHWRFQWDQLPTGLADEIRNLVAVSDRLL